MKRFLCGTFASLSIFVSPLSGIAADVGPQDIKKNAVRSRHIQKNAVKSSDIAKGAVKSPDIRDGGVKTQDLADNAVTGSKIADGSVDTSELADEAVNATKIENGAVGTPEIADSAVMYSKLQPSLLMSVHFSGNGTPYRATPGVSVTRAGKGQYYVLFPVDVTDCFFAGNARSEPGVGFGAATIVSFQVSALNPFELFVYSFNAVSVVPVDHPVNVIAMCA